MLLNGIEFPEVDLQREIDQQDVHECGECGALVLFVGIAKHAEWHNKMKERDSAKARPIESGETSYHKALEASIREWPLDW